MNLWLMTSTLTAMSHWKTNILLLSSSSCVAHAVPNPNRVRRAVPRASAFLAEYSGFPSPNTARGTVLCRSVFVCGYAFATVAVLVLRRSQSSQSAGGESTWAWSFGLAASPLSVEVPTAVPELEVWKMVKGKPSSRLSNPSYQSSTFYPFLHYPK